MSTIRVIAYSRMNVVTLLRMHYTISRERIKVGIDMFWIIFIASQRKQPRKGALQTKMTVNSLY